jgi:hypothetical protein
MIIFQVTGFGRANDQRLSVTLVQDRQEWPTYH